MNWILLVAGVICIAVVMCDALVTTLAVTTSSGPITGRLTHRLWMLGLRGGNDRTLQTLGLVLTLVILVLWLTLLWTGWTLVFSADPTAVVNTATGESVGFWDRVYFAGYTLFTLGNGDLRPEGALWKVATILALVNGLSLASLGITYLIPVTSAASERRRLATTINGLGDAPDDVLIRAWNGRDFGFLPQQLVRIAPDVDLLAQRHLTYPVLHFFHSREARAAAAVALSRLDEAVTLLRAGVAEPAAMDSSASGPLRNSLTGFLDTLRSAFIEPADTPPPLPTLRRLRDAGIPTVDDDEFARRVEDLSERRRALLGFLRNDAWNWSDVWVSPEGEVADRDEPKTSRSD